MTRVFVLTNHKGGVGKSTSATTIALGISALLRRAGASNPRVLLIDTDSQGHATLITTGRNDYSTDNSLYTVLSADRQSAAQTLVALAAFIEEQGGIPTLLSAISDAASWDDQVSEGQSLSEREEAVLQALEPMTRHMTQIVWVKSAVLRDKVVALMGHGADKQGDGQSIGHILKRLHLIDEGRRKRRTDGIAYAVSPLEVVDLMRCYGVGPIPTDETKKNPT